MPKVIEKTVYTFDELSPEAREVARDWWRECENMDCDFESVLDDVASICEMLGITLDTHGIRTVGGFTRTEHNIWFSLSYSQGDGASIEGTYHGSPESLAKVREHAPEDTELHAIAAELGTLQALNSRSIVATLKRNGSRDCHEYSVTIEVDDFQTGEPMAEETAELVRELLRRFMRWIHKQIRDEHEWRMKDETVDETILENEYTFDEDGRRAG